MNYIPLRTELTPMNSSCTFGNLKELLAFGRAIPLRIHTRNIPSRIFGVLTKINYYENSIQIKYQKSRANLP
jgi:hypothetical protein